MKKGMTNQVFIFISALILMALILVFGIKSVRDLTKTSDSAELALFVGNIRDETAVFYNNDVGSSKELRLKIPKDVGEICIFDKDVKINKKHKDNLFNSILEGTNYNVFILPLDNFQINQINVDYLKNDPSENPLCISTNGVFKGLIEVKSSENDVYVEIKRI